MSRKRQRPKPRAGQRPAPVPSARPSARLVARLAEADDLMRRRRWAEAREILESLDREYPGQGPILTLLVNLAYETNDYPAYLEAAEQLAQISPNDADLHAALAGAYLMNDYPARSLQAFRAFLERWPDHALAANARDTIQKLEPGLREMIAEIGLEDDEGLELAALHEAVQALLAQGRYADARRTAQRILERKADFAPSMNNISQTYLAEGRIDEAMMTAQEVLAFDPDNVHALSNSVHFALMSGHREEARGFAERLKQSQAPAFEKEIKIAEALTYLGDDAGVLEAVRRAESSTEPAGRRAAKTPNIDPMLDNPLFHHLAAVAALRLGNEKEARQRWKRSLALSPGFDLAQSNLDDLRLPAEQRNAPWAFPLDNWVTHQTRRDLASALEPAARRKREDALKEAACAFLRRHPEILEIVPALLDRGDPAGRQFAFMLAQMTETPEMLSALRDFALSVRGPDAMRMEAAQKATQAGLLGSGAIRMWLEGGWREVIQFGYELYEGGEHQHSDEVAGWMEAAMERMRADDGREAERLLSQALEVEPDAPNILNNLAAAFSLQGRGQDAERLIEEIHARHPDYFFGRTNLAAMYAHKGKVEEARALLEPLLSRRKLHYSEFASLCDAQVEVSLAAGDTKSAQTWLQMWERAYPEHPGLAQMRLRVDAAVLSRRLPRKRPR